MREMYGVARFLNGRPELQVQGNSAWGKGPNLQRRNGTTRQSHVYSRGFEPSLFNTRRQQLTDVSLTTTGHCAGGRVVGGECDMPPVAVVISCSQPLCHPSFPSRD